MAAYTLPPPEGFVLIPSGSYTRGDHKNENEAWMEPSRPVHDIHVSGFYMAKTPITYEEWKYVYDWALANGYSFRNAGQRASSSNGTALSDTVDNNQHPVVRVDWYDVVKWCNARSEMDGLTPVYYTDDQHTEVYKQGRHNVTNAQVRWDANGYRLPTEAEWEKAARGGLHGKRWPWGDADIDGTWANYRNSSETSGTTAVGSYPANGYGLYDMAGNVWEWNWDWYSATWFNHVRSRDADTRGPVSGSRRVYSGGSWGDDPELCRLAYRSSTWPIFRKHFWGFRVAKNEAN